MDSSGSVEQTSGHPFAAKVARFERRPAESCAATVMLLEEDPATAELITECLRGSGYRVLRARMQDEALVQVRQRAVGLVLLGGGLLSRGGAAFIAELRAQSPHTRLPMIVISDDKSALAQADQVGVEDYLPTAFESADLLHLVDELCA